MIRRRVGIASVDESVWASLFTSTADRTYLDASAVPPQWSVTLASTQRDGSPVVLSSDVRDASATAPSPSQALPRDKPKKDNKRPHQGDPLDAHRARPPPPVGPHERGGRGHPPGPMAAPAPCAMATVCSSPCTRRGPGCGHGPFRWHSAPLTAPTRDTPAHGHPLCSAHQSGSVHC